ncbi:hypothetical protein [Bacillus marinisedimentorum]|uniref:hypothetical protein n=1 Tax=Bacillus marinisedimentorum TaxID=1821260 RepID=UPI001FE0C631|nr:hypothetical protein [Bacillus marinisedimentorum]
MQEDVGNEYDQTERFPTDVLEKTKSIAIDFAAAYHTYDAEEPLRYLENSVYD